jgi:antitoxin component of RelBE/YafQ-DinJ toxin-antitoxin module
MNKYSVINLKIDPQLKKLAAKTAEKLGVSISAVLNNELRRFSVEQSVSFELPEAPNLATAALLETSQKEILSGNYHHFDNDKAGLEFLASELQ